jgi:hypothetical protein
MALFRAASLAALPLAWCVAGGGLAAEPSSVRADSGRALLVGPSKDDGERGAVPFFGSAWDGCVVVPRFFPDASPQGASAGDAEKDGLRFRVTRERDCVGTAR